MTTCLRSIVRSIVRYASSTGAMVIVCGFAIGCHSGSENARGPGQDAQDESARFANADGNTAFVGDEGCFDCHEDQYVGYQTHGMASSFYPLTPENAVGDYNDIELYHEISDLYYRILREDDRFYQEESRRDSDGNVIHRLRREMEYVVGSGSVARTYLTEEQGRYYELPLTWYSQTRRWDFSPGYDQFNARFGRLIPDRCMACHNSYPETVTFVEGKYDHVPNGIGCERCHGPGSIHVDARLAMPEPSGSVDTTIVNPRHLALDRRLDVCQQCHLHTTVSLLRERRTAYDFRPSQALDNYVSLFIADKRPTADAIDVISHADRMKSSLCFIESLETDAPMDCITCHNPHEGFRDAGPEYFNTTCQTCHDIAALQPGFEQEELRAVHGAESNCFSCHMPKMQAEGTPHASFTDHWIRIVDEEPGGSDPPVGSVIRLEPYFQSDEDADVYRGMAYIVYGRQTRDTSALQSGIRILEQALENDDNATFGEAYFLLGFAQLKLGEVDNAISPLERSVTLNPEIPERLNVLAQAYEAAGRGAESIERLYRRALELQPALAEVRINLGRFLEMHGRAEEAIEEYEIAVREHPWLEEGHYNLGTALLRDGDFERAETSLRAAIQLNPDNVDALGNFGLLLASSGRHEEAREHFERALKAEPANPIALGNLGAYHLNAGNLNVAVDLLERAVESEPAYVDGLVNLALAYYRLDNTTLARRYAEEVLRIVPDHGTASDLLEAL